MDYIKTLSHSTPINDAIQLIQQLPITHTLTHYYSRSLRNERIFVGAATFLTIYNLVSYIKEKTKRLHEPPMVPFGLPFVGHTLYLFLFPKQFIDWCNHRYGELYNIIFFGKTVTVSSGLIAQEVLKADMKDLSLDEATGTGTFFRHEYHSLYIVLMPVLLDLLHMQYVFSDESRYFGRKNSPVVAKMVIPQSKMPLYIPSIQKGLESGLKDNFNQNGPTIINHPSEFLQHLVGYMSVPSLLGEEFANNRPVIDSFAEFTNDLVANMPIFTIVPKFLHKAILPFLQSTKKHHKVMNEYVIPVARQRREKMRQAREAGVDHGLEQNFMNSLIEFVLDVDENGQPVYYNDDQLVEAILNIAFAAVHTSSTNLSYCIYWLIARPDLKEKLMKEIEQVLPGDTPLTYENLQKMKFLNNFVRECLRQGADILANAKKAMKDYTFSNGYQVPQGRTVQTTTRQLNFGDNKNRFTVQTMDPEMSQNRTSTTPSKDFVTFGMGKHLCPGKITAYV